VAAPVFIEVYDASNAPVLGAVLTFDLYKDKTGGARPLEPTIVELGGGQYRFTPTDDDEAVGTVALVNTGGNFPLRAVFAIHRANNQFWPVYLEQASGAPWAGAAPTIADYRNAAGADLIGSAPAVVPVDATKGTYSISPSSAHIAAIVGVHTNSPAGAYPEHWHGYTVPVPSPPTPTPAPTTFNVVSEVTGLPLAGALGGFTVQAWDAFTGSPRTPPAVVEIGGGVYQIQPTDLDAAAGVAVLVTTGHEPTHWLFEVYREDRSNQFIALLFLNDVTGVLWPGPSPAVTMWSGSPTPTPVKLADGVWVIRPSAQDIVDNAIGAVTAPAGAMPPEYTVGVHSVFELEPEPPAPPPPGLPLPGPSITSALGDVRLTLDEWLRGDARLIGNDLETDEGLETALYLSLFLDRYDETIEDPTQRRGWWADGIDGTDSRIGSRLWLAEVAGKLTADLPDKLRTWCTEATQWLLDDDVAREIEITPTLTAQGYELAVIVHRPNKTDPSRFRFSRVWAAQEKR
jgi:phage gp46-like protein